MKYTEDLTEDLVTDLTQNLTGDVVAPGEVWILATNFWNDSGVWIDTETWND